jgi:DNA mismatch repair protein MutS2
LEDLARRRQEIAEMVAQLQAAPALARAVEAQHRIARFEAEEERESARQQVRADESQAAPGGEIRPGLPVRHARLGVEGVVIEVDAAGALVQMGALRTKVAREDLVPLARKPKGAVAGFRKTAQEKIARAEAVRAAPASTATRPLDVRGLRVDEALRALEEELDRRLREGVEEVQVLHGHGSGALKAAIREHLARSPYVRKARAGASHEGGDGVTVVELRG